MRSNLQRGYVIVPRKVLNGLFGTRRAADGYDEAYLRVLAHVNYKSVVCQWNGYPLRCQRGEAIYTYVQWAELLGWTRKRTVHFFRWLFMENRIRRVESPCPTHIHLNGYEEGVVAQAALPPTGPCAQEAPGEDFDTFWKTYHHTTEKPKVNIGRARREWRKLSLHEKRLALQNIDNYYDHLSHIKYCKQAASYLADKSFKDEYDD